MKTVNMFRMTTEQLSTSSYGSTLDRGLLSCEQLQGGWDWTECDNSITKNQKLFLRKQ